MARGEVYGARISVVALTRTGVLARRGRSIPVGLRPGRMAERNSMFDVTRWIFEGGGVDSIL